MKVYSLGIGTNIDPTQLNDIASSNNNVFTADSFAALTPVAKSIVQNSCPGRLRSENLKCTGHERLPFVQFSLGCINDQKWKFSDYILCVMCCIFFRVSNDKYYLQTDHTTWLDIFVCYKYLGSSCLKNEAVISTDSR